MIDDDPGVIASLRFVFDADYDVYPATTIGEGLRLFEKIRPLIVLLDLKLPDGSGIDALREIRRIDPGAIVVILTAYSTRLAAEESLRLGAVDYVNKPFTVDDLRSRVAKLASFVHPPSLRPPSQAPAKKTEGNLSELQEIQNASAAFLHDVAGPLSGLTVASDLMNQRLQMDEATSEEIISLAAMVADNVRYMGALLEQWRTFSELHVSLRDKCHIQAAIDLAVRQVMSLMPSSNVVFQIQAQRGTHYVPGNHFALARVLINLLKNAYEAVSPNCGRISLTVTTTDTHLQIVVSDNGPGVPADQIPKLFLPQFTTKSGGRGLGLFIAKKIIEAVKGTITTHVPGNMLGTDFIITLPLV